MSPKTNPVQSDHFAGFFYAFFPNFPCLSLFFLNFPCFISFLCFSAPLLVTFSPSHFLFLSLSVKETWLPLKQAKTSRQRRVFLPTLHLLMLTTAVLPAFFSTWSHSSSSPRILYLETQRKSLPIQQTVFSFQWRVDPNAHSSSSISFTFSRSFLCRSSNSLAASVYESGKQLHSVSDSDTN